MRLEETLSERQTTMESLRSQLAAVLEEHALCERELGGRRGELTTREMQLRVRGVCVCVCVCMCTCVSLVSMVISCYPTHPV